MKLWMILLAPVICALIGWVTNYIAVKMLFHPKRPVKVGPVTFFGIFPKRQKALAEKLGEVISTELVNAGDACAMINDPEMRARFDEMLNDYMDRMLRVRLVEAIPMAAMFMTDETVAKIKAALAPEIERIVPEIICGATDALKERFDVKAIVKEKLEAFSSDKLEEILMAVMRKELKFVEVVGGVLGFLVGVFQAVFFALGG